MSLPSLIVAEDNESAIYRLREHQPNYSVIDIDLNYSRTITFSEIPSKNQINYHDLREYLASSEVPSDVILILDLGYARDNIFAEEIKQKNLDFRDIPANQLAGVYLAIAAIHNKKIKNLMIFFATTRDNRADAFGYLAQECNNATQRLQVRRKFTNYLGCAEFIVGSKTKEENQIYTRNYLDDVVVQWQEWNTVNITKNTIESVEEPKVKEEELEFQIRFEGSVVVAKSSLAQKYKRHDLSTVKIYLDARTKGSHSKFIKAKKPINPSWMKSFFYEISRRDSYFLSNKEICALCDEWGKKNNTIDEKERAYKFLTEIHKYLAETYTDYKFRGRTKLQTNRKKDVVKQADDKSGLILVAEPSLTSLK